MAQKVPLVIGTAFLVVGGLVLVEPWNPQPGEHVTISVGGPHERSFYLEEGQGLDWRWRSDQPVRFDVHSHDGDAVVEHVVVDGKKGRGSFMAPTEGVYSLFWNATSGVPSSVEYTIHTDGWDLDSEG